ncbi:MAG: hypothetical protein H7A46_26570 [Verrucomicrobiales bacterium]|nr:hypothetical protein [Verrucomicrobiales bacterium]
MDSSDKERRSLKDVLSEEAKRFLKPPETTEKEEAPCPPPEPDQPNPAPAEEHLTHMTVRPSPNLSVVVPAIVSMTFRLPAPLAGQLVGVATERKLQRDKPYTQQDIVVEALRQWFLRNGYGPFGGC